MQPHCDVFVQPGSLSFSCPHCAHQSHCPAWLPLGCYDPFIQYVVLVSGCCNCLLVKQRIRHAGCARTAAAAPCASSTESLKTSEQCMLQGNKRGACKCTLSIDRDLPDKWTGPRRNRNTEEVCCPASIPRQHRQPSTVSGFG
jgi:hypothetical protein